MKKIMMTMVAAISLSTACMATEVTMNSQGASLVRYLNLDDDQVEAVVSAAEKYQLAADEQMGTSDANQLWLLTNDHLLEIRQILDNEQFKSYLWMLDKTLENKGLNTFTGHVWVW